MAKEEKKPAGETHDERVRRLLIEIFSLILFLFLIARLISIYSVKNNIYDAFLAFLQSYGLLNLFHSIIFYTIIVSIILSALFLFGIIYTAIKLREIQKVWYAMLHPVSVNNTKKEVKNEKWQRVLTHISSPNSSDWRLAILECDIILDEMFDKQGYVGGTIGDKLKSVDPAHFKTLNNAWEAHKIRNAIAHEGSDFNMTDREARRVVSLYESVFNEFDFI